MSDDEIRKKAEETKRKRMEAGELEQLRGMRERVIRAGMDELWSNLVSKMQHHTGVLNQAYANDPNLQLEWNQNKPSKEFSVHRRVFPQRTLKVNLNPSPDPCIDYAIASKDDRWSEAAVIATGSFLLDVDRLGNVVVLDASREEYKLESLEAFMFEEF